MSAVGSEHPVNPDGSAEAVEADAGRTRFRYGDGGVPIYVGIVWVGFIICYLVVMAAVALPDFIAWTSS